MKNKKPIINRTIAAVLFGFLGFSILMLSYRDVRGSTIGRQHQISFQKLQLMIEYEKPQFVNVLDKDSYEDCHIAGDSYNISLKKLMQNAKKATRKLDHNRPVVIYCGSYRCGASKEAFPYIHKLGFKTYVYEGGTNEWLHKGGKTKGPCKLNYLQKKIKSSARHTAKNR